MNNRLHTIISIIIIAIFFVFCCRLEQNYSIDAVVEKVDGKEVVVVDEAGYEWQFESEEEFKTNDEVKLFFDNKMSVEDRTDDEITKVKRK